MDRIADLTEQIKAKAEEARQIAEHAENNGGWTSESKEKVKALLDEVKDLKARLDDHKDGGEFARQLADLSADLGGTGTSPPPGEYRPLGRDQTLGAAFTSSEQYKHFLRQWPEGRIPDRARVNMDPVGVKDLISVTGTAGAHGLVPPDYQGLVDVLGRPTPRVRSLISRRTTTSDLIEYVRQLTRENAADWVPEAQSIDDDAAIKPMGGFTFEVATSAVDTVAEWIPITKRAVMDAAQLRGMIDDELRGDILDAEERAFLYGGGGSGQIEGLDQVSGTQQQPFDTDLFTTTRKAKSLVIYGGFAQPTAYLINVEDDERIDLERDQQGRFFGAGPFGTGPNTLWGLPRIVSEFLQPGEAWLADWRRAVVWDRQQATISVSDAHADFFIRNLIAVLGEQREAFGVIRPSAFVKIQTSSTPAPPPPPPPEPTG